MPAVVIISADSEFAGVMAEQLTRELALECRTVATPEAAQSLVSASVLTIGDGTQPMASLGLPVLEFAKENAPFRLRDMLAQVAQQLAGPTQALELGGGYQFLPRARQIKDAAGSSVELTDRELGLIAALLAAGEEGIGKDALLRQVWGFEAADINTHTLETHVYRLRSKMREAFGTEMIAAIEGGYKLEI